MLLLDSRPPQPIVCSLFFDIRGDIKIFDFGLAKELKPCDREGKDQFRTSGLAGTRRYMAPEVAQVMPYGELPYAF